VIWVCPEIGKSSAGETKHDGPYLGAGGGKKQTQTCPLFPLPFARRKKGGLSSGRSAALNGNAPMLKTKKKKKKKEDSGRKGGTTGRPISAIGANADRRKKTRYGKAAMKRGREKKTNPHQKNPSRRPLIMAEEKEPRPAKVPFIKEPDGRRLAAITLVEKKRGGGTRLPRIQSSPRGKKKTRTR